MHKVLIVDDNLEVRNLVRLSLGFGHYQIREAADAEQALQQIRDWRPDLVLLDIMMPGELDGLDVCRMIKQDAQLRTTLIVMLTARGQQSDLELGRAASADAYIVKPFSPTELNAMLNRMLAANKAGATPD